MNQKISLICSCLPIVDLKQKNGLHYKTTYTWWNYLSTVSMTPHFLERNNTLSGTRAGWLEVVTQEVYWWQNIMLHRALDNNLYGDF